MGCALGKLVTSINEMLLSDTFHFVQDITGAPSPQPQRCFPFLLRQKGHASGETSGFSRKVFGSVCGDVWLLCPPLIDVQHRIRIINYP